MILLFVCCDWFCLLFVLLVCDVWVFFCLGWFAMFLLCLRCCLRRLLGFVIKLLLLVAGYL